MTIIKSGWDPLYKILCSACDDSHYLTIERNKDLKHDNEQDALYFEFKEIYPTTLWERKTRVLYRLSHYKSFISGADQTDNGITIGLDQLGELYGGLYSVAQEHEIISQDDITYINDISLNKHFVNFYEDTWVDTILYKSSDNFILSHMGSEKDGEITVGHLQLGWTLPKYITWKQLFKKCMAYIFKKSRFYIDDYSGFIKKDEVVELLSIMNWLLSRENNGVIQYGTDTTISPSSVND